jgi:A/G-specific adenine glycosylase
MTDFATRLTLWQRAHGRNDLPWQGAGAYRIWLSEIMLQQTQVATVIPYYQRFVASFPDIAALASAAEEQVLEHWSGLGYYARGRNLHRAARLIADKYQGVFPKKFEQILELPGVGRSTAAAICALANDERRAILDGNVKRVLARYCGIHGWPMEERLWLQAEALLPHVDVAVYTQALMDMGAMLCKRSRPCCGICPVQAGCVAFQLGSIAELPTPRPRKVVKVKQCIFLLLLHGNDILLDKRPGSGIWGGLWCMPQFDDNDALSAWCVQEGIDDFMPARGHNVSTLPPFTHTFTHFKLHITPVLMRVTQKRASDRMWFSVADALQAAIPTPVRQLLKKLSGEQNMQGG